MKNRGRVSVLFEAISFFKKINFGFFSAGVFKKEFGSPLKDPRTAARLKIRC